MALPCKVFLIDDNTTFLRQVQRYLETVEGIVVIGTTSQPSEAASLCSMLCPDVCVVDISMPEVSGLQLVPRLKEAYPKTRVVMLTSHADACYREAAEEAGADEYVIKPDVFDHLAAAIVSVHGTSLGEEPPDGD